MAADSGQVIWTGWDWRNERLGKQHIERSFSVPLRRWGLQPPRKGRKTGGALAPEESFSRFLG
jgi:hypothetical protein